MKIDDIKVGDEYYTRVSGMKVKVVVKNIVTHSNGRRYCQLARVDNGSVLVKLRHASALHTSRDFMND